MRKLAIYVEGHTEQAFVARFIEEIASKGQVVIDEVLARGGARGPRTIQIIKASKAVTAEKYYVLIVNSGGESRVASDVRDNYVNLKKGGYIGIIALRDVFPSFSAADIPRLRTGLMSGIPTTPIHPLFVLGIMEIESWFLAEHLHFQKLDTNLNCQAISAALGFDPSVDDMQLRPKPSDDLRQAYALVGQTYNKSKIYRERTVDLLDYAHLYLELPNKFRPDLQAFTEQLTSFLQSE